MYHEFVLELYRLLSSYVVQGGVLLCPCPGHVVGCPNLSLVILKRKLKSENIGLFVWVFCVQLSSYAVSFLSWGGGAGSGCR